MAIIDTLTESSFRAGIASCRPDNFSYVGITALYEYLEQLSEDTGEDIEFDPIAICCEYAEYSNFDEFKSDYSIWCDNHNVETLEDLQNEIWVLMIDDNMFIIEQF
jgi:hypothetical protein